jgi:hypothetical protein
MIFKDREGGGEKIKQPKKFKVFQKVEITILTLISIHNLPTKLNSAVSLDKNGEQNVTCIPKILIMSEKHFNCPFYITSFW